MQTQGENLNSWCSWRVTWTRSCMPSAHMSQSFRNWNYRCRVSFYDKPEEISAHSSQSLTSFISLNTAGLPQRLRLFHWCIQNLPTSSFCHQNRIWKHFRSVWLQLLPQKFESFLKCTKNLNSFEPLFNQVERNKAVQQNWMYECK